MNWLSGLATFYHSGGFFMHFILATGVVIAAIVAERVIVIGGAAAVNARKLTDDVVRAASRGDHIGARNVAMMSNAPVGKVAQAMLQAGPADEATLQAAADDAATLALPPLVRNLAHLSLLANVVTLFGLLGTIFGLITAFSGVSAADPSQRTAILAAGISAKLNSTAFGLIIAVPTLLIHGFLVSVVDGIVEQVDAMTVRLSRSYNAPAAGHAHAHGQVVAMPAQKIANAAPAVAPAAGWTNVASQGGSR